MSRGRPAFAVQATAPVRLRQLDVLRGIAILLVLGRHQDIAQLWMRAGWVGVDLFFVLSGFLVSGLLFAEFKKSGEISLTQFFIRRGLKIYPPFYVLMLATTVVQAGAGNFVTSRFLPEFFFVQNYFLGCWGHTWSLAVEEHFYLMLAIGLYLFARAGKDRADPFASIPRVFALAAAALLTGRILTTAFRPFDPMVHVFPTHLRLDSLLFGVMLSYFHHFRYAWLTRLVTKNRTLLWIAAAVLVSPCLLLDLESPLMHTVGFSCLYLGFGPLLLVSLYQGGGWPHAFRGLSRPMGDALAWVGRDSYSIYLWHMPVAQWIMRPFVPATLHPLAAFLIYTGSSIFIGSSMAALIEKPVLSFRDRVFPRRREAGLDACKLAS